MVNCQSDFTSNRVINCQGGIVGIIDCHFNKIKNYFIRVSQNFEIHRNNFIINEKWFSFILVRISFHITRLITTSIFDYNIIYTRLRSKITNLGIIKSITLSRSSTTLANFWVITKRMGNICTICIRITFC